MHQDLKTFCSTCLHCISTLTGNKIPRPLSHTLHSDTPNEIIHFDYLFMESSHEGFTYLLILKDDTTSFVWLEPCVATNAETTKDILLNWFSIFGVVPMWISDRESHFKNKLMHQLNKALHSQHHFTTPYHPESNGTVESVCREVLRFCRALLSELRINQSNWPVVLSIIQSILSHNSRSNFGDRAPITAFTGLPADNPLRTIANNSLPAKVTTIGEIEARKIVHANDPIQSLDEMHKDVSQLRTRQRKQAIAQHNRKTNVRPYNFEVGDFVLVSQADEKQAQKLFVRWKGPFHITRTLSDHSFDVKDMVQIRHKTVHVSRMRSMQTQAAM